ncbi:trichohyalin-like [Clytia hemisphaerica]|uniref:Uncharacterized protein n=1 Tax=Clytia hemisphaerica TaxID=252671 RepID=A0A7M5XH15_9CNID
MKIISLFFASFCINAVYSKSLNDKDEDQQSHGNMVGKGPFRIPHKRESYGMIVKKENEAEDHTWKESTKQNGLQKRKVETSGWLDMKKKKRSGDEEDDFQKPGIDEVKDKAFIPMKLYALSRKRSFAAENNPISKWYKRDSENGNPIHKWYKSEVRNADDDVNGEIFEDKLEQDRLPTRWMDELSRSGTNQDLEDEYEIKERNFKEDDERKMRQNGLQKKDDYGQYDVEYEKIMRRQADEQQKKNDDYRRYNEENEKIMRRQADEQQKKNDDYRSYNEENEKIMRRQADEQRKKNDYYRRYNEENEKIMRRQADEQRKKNNDYRRYNEEYENLMRRQADEQQNENLPTRWMKDEYDRIMPATFTLRQHPDTFIPKREHVTGYFDDDDAITANGNRRDSRRFRK